jgi:hypothetical protein
MYKAHNPIPPYLILGLHVGAFIERNHLLYNVTRGITNR